MPYTISEIIVLFFTYSFIGWLWETIYCSIKDHHYEYRGFLFGPYCPVYGFAVTTVLICTKDVQDNIFLLFIVGIIVATVFEYVASLFLEKVFHLKLWDYSKLWGNIQGRVAPVISLFWGFGVILLVKFIQPFVQKIINIEERDTHGWLAVGITIVMGIDTILTVISVERFHITTKMWDNRINQFIERVRSRVESRMAEKGRLKVGDWHHSVIQHYDELKPNRLSWNQKRMLKSFPKLRVLDAPKFMEIKKAILEKENRSNKNGSLSNGVDKSQLKIK